MRDSVSSFLVIFTMMLSGCATTSSTSNSFSSVREFSPFVNGSAEIGNVYAITGQMSSYGTHGIRILEIDSRVHSIPGDDKKPMILHCEYPIKEILNVRHNIYDVLFIYEGAEWDGAGGTQRNRTYLTIAKGEIIGTRNWAHPDYQKEWNEWAGMAAESEG